MGGIWHQAGCCCGGVPCTDCTGEQPDLVATVAGGPCDADCQGAAGTYVFSEYFEDPHYDPDYRCCVWVWRDGPHSIWLVYDEEGKRWYALAAAGLFGTEWFGGSVSLGHCENPGGPFYLQWKEVTGLVFCNKTTGKLVGEFSLDGRDAHVDCTGCALEVTLGG